MHMLDVRVVSTRFMKTFIAHERLVGIVSYCHGARANCRTTAVSMSLSASFSVLVLTGWRQEMPQDEPCDSIAEFLAAGLIEPEMHAGEDAAERRFGGGRREPSEGAFDVRQHVRRPFSLMANATLQAESTMTLDALVSFILSQASSINAVTVGAASLGALEARLREGLAPHVPHGAAATARFDVPFALLRRVS